jgi:hypothetical protein
MKTKKTTLSYVAASFVAAAMISAATPAVAGDQVPFNGTVSGQIPSDLGPPVEGTGVAFLTSW